MECISVFGNGGRAGVLTEMKEKAVQKRRGTVDTILRYLFGNVLVFIASLASFPILTRILTVSDYGTLSLIVGTLTILYAVAKMGIQNGIIRFYGEYEYRGAESSREFFSTYLFSMLAMGGIVWVVYIIAIPLIADKILGIQNTRPFYIASFLIPAHCFFSLVYNFYWARQDTAKFNLSGIMEAYVPLTLGIIGLILSDGALEWFFIGGVAGRLIYAVFFGRLLRKACKVSPRAVSRGLLERSFLYGFPLMLFELSSNLLAYGDRFLVKYYLSAREVGIYVVGYNLAMYLANIVVIPSNNAVQSRYMDMWAKRGREETEAYVSMSLTGLIGVLAFIGFTSAAIFRDIILLFASSKYLESVAVAPIVLASLLIYSMYPIYGAGIYLAKKTRILLYCILFALVINVALNLLLIPRLGIMGAAFATLGAYLSATVCILFYSSRFFTLRIPLRSAAVFLAAGIAAYLCIGLISIGNHLLSIVVKGTLSLAVYVPIVLVLDPAMLDKGRKMIRDLRTV
jgi:O-antigen/teichoic acid export membrane protein